MRSLVKGDHCSYIDIDFLLQRKFQLCGQQICDMYQLLGLYQKLNAKSICSCVNKSVQAINKGNNETQDSYSEKSLIKEVEEVLSRAHLTLFPHQTEKTLIVILESGKSVSLSKEKSIEQTKSKTYNSHLPSRHKQNFPAFCKVPYKTDMCMWKRGRIVSSNHQTVKTPMKIKEHKNTMEENNCVIKECTGEQKHIKHSCLQNMNLISDLDPECACSQSQELQRAGLVRQLDKGLYRLRFLVWRIGQITKWDGEDILLTFYKKYVTKSEVIPSMYLPIQSCNLAGVLFDRFSSLILLIDINMASQEEIYWIRCILSRFIHLLKMLKLILARTNHRSSGSHVRHRIFLITPPFRMIV
ncbi:unnamed protein product [Heterobilharzia americana]|nr:unnamed protein product [Heterobilharzia americana]